MDPIEITFKDGFRLWYVCDCTGPAIIVSEPEFLQEIRNTKFGQWMAYTEVHMLKVNSSLSYLGYAPQ